MATPRPDSRTDGGVVDATLRRTQTKASPLGFHGDVLVHSHDGELREYDAPTMRRTNTWTLSHRHFCFVPSGAIVAFGFVENASASTIHRIAKATVETHPGPILPRGGTNVVLPGRAPDTICVSVRDKIYLLRVADPIDVEQILDHPHPDADTRDQLATFGDGRIIGGARESGFRVLDPQQQQSAVYPTPRRYVKHIAAATRSRVWYSYVSLDLDEEWNAHTLILAPVDAPMAAERTFDLAPGRIVHLASHGDVAAVLVLGPRDGEPVGSLAVFDATGERWRVDVDADPRGFVAIGERHVALAMAGALRAWDAATGTPIAAP